MTNERRGVRLVALPSRGLSVSRDDPEDARARELIVTLGLRPLEGESGYFVEIGRSASTVTQGGRSLAAQSRIFYMLTRERPVNFVHWLASDDTHVLLEGGPVDYFLFDPDGRASKRTMAEDVIRRVITVPAGSGKALRLHLDARYALLVNVLSPEWTRDRMRIGNSPDCLDAYEGRAPWATRSFLRELIAPERAR
jgi:predicted cupin superfamily sugar epimerase